MTYLLKNCVLFDALHPGYALEILVDGETILAVGTGLSAPEGAAVLDLGGRMVFPGFIDAHVLTSTSCARITAAGFSAAAHTPDDPMPGAFSVKAIREKYAAPHIRQRKAAADRSVCGGLLSPDGIVPVLYSCL